MLFLFLVKQINLLDSRDNYKLSLRKEKCQKKILSQRKINIENKQLEICPFKLKIKEEDLNSFRINDNNIDESIKKSITFLTNSNEDYVKFGVFLFGKYFKQKVEEENKSNKTKTYEFYIDKFLEYNVIDYIKNVLINFSEPNIFYECFLFFINFTNFPSIQNKYEYYCQFSNSDFLNIYKKTLFFNDSQIITSLFDFLFNICFENEICLKKIYESNILKEALNKYSNSDSINFNEIISFLHFIAIMTKNSNVFSEEEKENFFKILINFISNNQSEEAICYSLLGINYLIEYDYSNKKTILNLLIKNNNDYINKFISINYFNLHTYTQTSITITLNILYYIFKNIENNDLLNILNNNSILDFYDFIFNNCEKYSIQLKILESILLISKNNDINIILKLTHHNLLYSIILISLTSYDFLIRKASLLIICYLLSLNNFDIASDIYKTQFIEYLTQKILKSETSIDIIQLSFNTIYYFIKCGCFFGKKNPFSNKFKEYGIEDIINKDYSNLSEELVETIDKIKKELDTETNEK